MGTSGGFVLVLILLLLIPGLCRAQYMYLDANGDGVNDASDRISSIGSTLVGLWLVTDKDSQGNAVHCDPDSALSINSYELILKAEGGTVEWSGFTNLQPTMLTQFGEADSPTEYHNGFGAGTILPAGNYKLCSIIIRPTSGSPSVSIEPSAALVGAYYTSFGSRCPGMDADNTLKLGVDWFDVGGLGPPSEATLTMTGFGEGVGQSETLSGGCIPAPQFCTFTALPSKFDPPEAHRRCCAHNEADSFVGCLLSFTCNGAPAANKTITIDVYPKQLTGGHCHANSLRPTSIPSSVQVTTNSDGIAQFVLTMPEVAGVLNMVPYSTSPDCIINSGRDTLYTICVRVPELFDLGPGEGYFISEGGPDNDVRHPSFHYGEIATIDALKIVALQVKEFVPSANDLEINDLSLEWGGRFDIITGLNNSRAIVCNNHSYNLADDWSAPHCGHTEGRTVDIKIKGQPSRAMRSLRMYFRKGRRIQNVVNPDNPAPGYFLPAKHGNHWHMDFH